MITVIVLLILAGTAVSIAINGGNIFDKANQAKESWNVAVTREEQKINEVWSLLENANKDWEIVTDNGTAGLSLGDIVRPTKSAVASEQFYVIGIDGTGNEQTVRLLSRYCIDPTENVQDPTAGTLTMGPSGVEGVKCIPYDTEEPLTGVYADSTLKDAVDAYTDKFELAGLTLEDVETEENGNPVSGVKGRIMWGNSTIGEVQDVLAINVTGVNGSTIVYEPAGTLISYWLGTLHPYGDFAVYSVREMIDEGTGEPYGAVLDQRSSINLLFLGL